MSSDREMLEKLRRLKELSERAKANGQMPANNNEPKIVASTEAEAVPNQTEAEKNLSFTEKVSESAKRRSDIFQDIEARKDKGEIGTFDAAFRQAGNVGAGLVSDVLGAAITEALEFGVSFTPKFIKEPIAEAGKDIAESAVGQVVIEGLNTASETYQNFKKASPNAAERLESAANLAAVGTPLTQTGRQVAKETAKSTAKLTASPATIPINTAKDLSTAIKGALSKNIEELDGLSEQIRNNANELFKQTRAQGAVLSTKKTDSISKELNDIIFKNPEFEDVADLRRDVFKPVIDELETLKQAAVKGGGQITLSQLNTSRSFFQSIARDNIDSPIGKLANQAARFISSQVADMKPGDFIGPPDAISDSLKATKAWAQLRKLDDIVELVRKSEGDAKKLKRQINNFLKKPKKNLRGFSKKEIAALKQINKKTAFSTMVDGLASMALDPENLKGSGFTLGLAGGTSFLLTGSPFLGGAIVGLGTAAKPVSTNIVRGRAQNVINTINSTNPLTER